MEVVGEVGEGVGGMGGFQYLGDFADEVAPRDGEATGVGGVGGGPDLRRDRATIGGCGGYSGCVCGGVPPELPVIQAVIELHFERGGGWHCEVKSDGGFLDRKSVV